jgi:hypothetical protein
MRIHRKLDTYFDYQEMCTVRSHLIICRVIIHLQNKTESKIMYISGGIVLLILIIVVVVLVLR